MAHDHDNLDHDNLDKGRIRRQKSGEGQGPHGDQYRIEKENELQRLVLTQYTALERLHAARYTGAAVCGMPIHLWELLPHTEEWCFSPLWKAPRRVQRWNGLRLRDSHSLREGFLNAEEAKAVEAVERTIELRAWLHLSKHHSERLITQASRRYYGNRENDQLQASQDPLDASELVAWALVTQFAMQGTIAELPQAPVDTIFIALRSYWLQHWLEWERIRLAHLRHKTQEYSMFGNFSALIKPEELGTVYDILKDKSGNHDLYETIGTWYSCMLYRCGADWRDMLALRRKRKSRLMKHGNAATRLQGAAAWGVMAEMRIEDYGDNISRKANPCRKADFAPKPKAKREKAVTSRRPGDLRDSTKPTI